MHSFVSICILHTIQNTLTITTNPISTTHRPHSLTFSLLQSNQFSIFNIFIDLFKIMVVAHWWYTYTVESVTIRQTHHSANHNMVKTNFSHRTWKTILAFPNAIAFRQCPSQTNSYHSERIIISKH